MNIVDDLIKLSDKDYALFQSKLTPNVDPSLFLGVRVPVLRKYSKELSKTDSSFEFFNKLPHKYYDENMLHSLLLSEIMDYEVCIKELDKFLPFVDNWAVCDILSPKIFKKNKDNLIIEIKKWIKSNHVYTARFGIEMLMSFYLDDDFKNEYKELPLLCKLDDYYIKMMIAWFYTTALSKKWDDFIYIIEENKLEKWTHNKTIQKCCESYKITDAQKKYLKSFKRS